MTFQSFFCISDSGTVPRIGEGTREVFVGEDSSLKYSKGCPIFPGFASIVIYKAVKTGHFSGTSIFAGRPFAILPIFKVIQLSFLDRLRPTRMVFKPSPIPVCHYLILDCSSLVGLSSIVFSSVPMACECHSHKLLPDSTEGFWCRSIFRPLVDLVGRCLIAL